MAKGKKQKETLTPEERLAQALVPVEEQPYEVPGNWVWTRLGASVRLHRGVSYKKKDVSTIWDGNVLILRGGNIREGSLDLFREDNVYVSKSLVTKTQLLHNGDILIVSSTGSTKVIGKAAISLATYENIAFGAFVTLVRPKQPINKKYIGLFFLSQDYRGKIGQLAKGVNINNIKNEYITDMCIPLPPFIEQQRIVKRVESLFEKLDRARELVQSALDSFEARKAAILHKAFTGELTARWRAENGVGMEGWKKYKLIDIVQEKPRNGYSPVGVAYETSVRNLTLSATTSGIFKADCFKYVDIKLEDSSYLWLKSGDILIQRANSLAYVGASATYYGPERQFIYPDLMMKVRANPSVANTKFLQYVLSSNSSRNYFRNNATGTSGNMPKINQKIVSSLPIVIPPLTEQVELVRMLDHLLESEEKAKDLGNILNQIDLMKKSILARAFRGQLGTNDPAEESAINLLKEILADAE